MNKKLFLSFLLSFALVMVNGQSYSLRSKYISLDKEVLLYDKIIAYFTEDGNYQEGQAFVNLQLESNPLAFYFGNALEKYSFIGQKAAFSYLEEHVKAENLYYLKIYLCFATENNNSRYQLNQEFEEKYPNSQLYHRIILLQEIYRLRPSSYRMTRVRDKEKKELFSYLDSLLGTNPSAKEKTFLELVRVDIDKKVIGISLQYTPELDKIWLANKSGLDPISMRNALQSCEGCNALKKDVEEHSLNNLKGIKKRLFFLLGTLMNKAKIKLTSSEISYYEHELTKIIKEETDKELQLTYRACVLGMLGRKKYLPKDKELDKWSGNLFIEFDISKDFFAFLMPNLNTSEIINLLDKLDNRRAPQSAKDKLKELSRRELFVSYGSFLWFITVSKTMADKNEETKVSTPADQVLQDWNLFTKFYLNNPLYCRLSKHYWTNDFPKTHSSEDLAQAMQCFDKVIERYPTLLYVRLVKYNYLATYQNYFKDDVEFMKEYFKSIINIMSYNESECYGEKSRTGRERLHWKHLLSFTPKRDYSTEYGYSTPFHDLVKLMPKDWFLATKKDLEQRLNTLPKHRNLKLLYRPFFLAAQDQSLETYLNYFHILHESKLLNWNEFEEKRLVSENKEMISSFVQRKKAPVLKTDNLENVARFYELFSPYLDVETQLDFIIYLWEKESSFDPVEGVLDKEVLLSFFQRKKATVLKTDNLESIERFHTLFLSYMDFETQLDFIMYFWEKSGFFSPIKEILDKYLKAKDFEKVLDIFEAYNTLEGLQEPVLESLKSAFGKDITWKEIYFKDLLEVLSQEIDAIIASEKLNTDFLEVFDQMYQAYPKLDVIIIWNSMFHLLTQQEDIGFQRLDLLKEEDILKFYEEEEDLEALFSIIKLSQVKNSVAKKFQNRLQKIYKK